MKQNYGNLQRQTGLVGYKSSVRMKSRSGLEEKFKLTWEAGASFLWIMNVGPLKVCASKKPWKTTNNYKFLNTVSHTHTHTHTPIRCLVFQNVHNWLKNTESQLGIGRLSGLLSWLLLAEVKARSPLGWWSGWRPRFLAAPPFAASRPAWWRRSRHWPRWSARCWCWWWHHSPAGQRCHSERRATQANEV